MKGLTKTAISAIFSFIVFFIILSAFSYSVYALDSDLDTETETEEMVTQLYEEVGADELFYQLPESAKDFLNEINMNDFMPQSTDNVDIDNFIYAVGNMLKSNIYEPLKILSCIIGIILITAVFDTLKNSSTSAALDGTLSVVSTLCLISVTAPPMLELVEELSNTVINSSSFMMIYVPVISVLIVTSGQQISGGAFYAMMIYISNAILQIASKIIIPLLKCVISLSIVSSVSDKVSLGGFISLFKKTVKWLLCFCMSLFVAFITMKSIVTVAEDTISNKVVKFAINNFVPLVGGALSDAYQTVVSCVGLLKSGVGVAAMIAIFAIFLPAILKCAIWQAVVAIGSALCEVFEIKKTCALLNSLGTVISAINAILLSIMVIYIVSTAIIIIVGG